jgi:ABC-type phosphate transport system substrate-binding protein
MMRYIFFLLCIFLLNAQESRAHAQIAVIAHRSSRITSMKKHEIVQIFLKKISRLPNGDPVTPRDQEAGPTKEIFYRAFFDSSLDEIHDYWIREVYRGAGRPPEWKNTKNDLEMRSYVSANPNAIGYIQRSFLTSAVREITVE